MGSQPRGHWSILFSTIILLALVMQGLLSSTAKTNAVMHFIFFFLFWRTFRNAARLLHPLLAAFLQWIGIARQFPIVCLLRKGRVLLHQTFSFFLLLLLLSLLFVVLFSWRPLSSSSSFYWARLHKQCSWCNWWLPFPFSSVLFACYHTATVK